MINVTDHLSVVLVGPDAADRDAFYEWISENVSSDVLFFGDTIAVEPRFVPPLLSGLREAGFEVAA